MNSISKIWILFGFIGIVIGFWGYNNYSSPKLYLVILPNVLFIKNIIFGIISVFIGIQIKKANQNPIGLISSFLFWIIGFIIISTIIGTFSHKSLELTYLFTFDYLYIPLVNCSIKLLSRRNGIQEKPLEIYSKKNKLTLVLVALSISMGIWGLSYLIPYELFY